MTFDQRFDILGRLPQEVVDLIFRCLTRAELLTLTSVSHHYRLLTDSTWRRICFSRRIPFFLQKTLKAGEPLQLPLRPLPWKDSFVNSERWREAVFQRHVVAQLRQPFMPKLQWHWDSFCNLASGFELLKNSNIHWVELVFICHLRGQRGMSERRSRSFWASRSGDKVRVKNESNIFSKGDILKFNKTILHSGEH